MVGVAREGALGLASGFSGLPESTSPVSDAVKSMAIPPPPSADSLASAAVGPAYGIAKGLLTGGAEAVKGGYSTVKGLLTGNPEAAWEGAQQGAHGLGSTIGQALQLEMGRAGANPEEAPPTMPRRARRPMVRASTSHPHLKLRHSRVRPRLRVSTSRGTCRLRRRTSRRLRARLPLQRRAQQQRSSMRSPSMTTPTRSGRRAIKLPSRAMFIYPQTLKL